ncbi:PAS domain-containing protein [Halomicroarcula sp. GCM10025709]|uniref:PAS domain-containing protein n=1 Tax=Halomicroarcula sp. GCM10025709 TaxID=3252669 RepID=UPI0036127292
MNERSHTPNGARGYRDRVESDQPDDEKSADQLRRERDEWRHLFTQLIEGFPEPMFAVDDDRVLRYFNEAAATEYGRDRTEAIGTEGYEFFGTEGESEILAETVARTGETVREEEFRSVPTPDGRLWNRSMAVAMTDLHGDGIGAVERTPSSPTSSSSATGWPTPRRPSPRRSPRRSGNSGRPPTKSRDSRRR